jgi:hypothetical protein
VAKPPFRVWGKRHTSAPGSRRTRGMRSMPHRSSICSVVVVLEVAAPLAPTLDGGAVVFSRVTAPSSTRRSVVARLATVGVRDITGDSSGDPREW